MTPDVKEALVQHYTLNMTPQESAYALRQQDPKSLVNYRDIENFRQQNKLYTIGIQGKVTATLDYLKSNRYWHKYHVNPETSELLHLVWLHPQSLETFRKCPDVVLFDCTFKTNQYNIPMINFVAPTGNNSTLHIGCGLLTGATQQVYEWALNALKECLIEYNLLHELRLVVLGREQVNNLSLCHYQINTNES